MILMEKILFIMPIVLLLVISACQEPIIYSDKPDQSSRLLGRGVKSAEELISEIEKGC